jgi:hypothetical protein
MAADEGERPNLHDDQPKTMVTEQRMLSRVRTRMSNGGRTCAVPPDRVTEVLLELESTCGADNGVAQYATDGLS